VDLGTSSNRSSPSRAPRTTDKERDPFVAAADEKGITCPELRTSATRAVWSPPARTTTHPKTATPTIRAVVRGSSCLERGVRESTRVSPRDSAFSLKRGDGLLGVRGAFGQRTDSRWAIRQRVRFHAQSSVTMVDPPGIEVCDRNFARGEVVRFSHRTSVFGRFRAPGESSRFRSKPPDLPATSPSRFACSAR